ncbi:MAG: hypothetical protein E6H67_03630 [Betaproteobacteria bacterium]|nr:MAG: hypothetical protein E6H67_03630 [Betaproteobacteria bacterium]
MRTIVDWPPGVAGMWNFSTGFAGSVTSMSIVPLASHALPFSGFGRVPAGQPPARIGMVLCMPANIIQRPSGYWMMFG